MKNSLVRLLMSLPVFLCLGDCLERDSQVLAIQRVERGKRIDNEWYASSVHIRIYLAIMWDEP